MAYSCCFGIRGNLDFPDFLQKSFITSTTGRVITREYFDESCCRCKIARVEIKLLIVPSNFFPRCTVPSPNQQTNTLSA